MKIEELQSTCIQIRQQVTEIPEALLENFLLQRNPSETSSGIQRVIVQNSTQVSNSKRPLSAQVALDEPGSVDTPISSILRSHNTTEQSKMLIHIC